VRRFLACTFLLLCGCGPPRLTFNWSQDMTPDQMLARADLVFVGVIDSHQIDPRAIPPALLPGIEPDSVRFWKVLRRRVRVELILRGAESRKRIDVYEIFWTGGTTGDWNNAGDGERDLFLVRLEGGRYHVVRDWWRSIFPVTTSPHRRQPLDDSHPLWERIALMNWWIERGDSSADITYPYFRLADPGRALSFWRTVKLARGLVRHPSPGVRVPACRELLMLRGLGQDECWEMLSESERTELSHSGYRWCSAKEIAAARQDMQMGGGSLSWSIYPDQDMRRVLTAVSNRKRRAQFCALYEREYPGDHDNGCPADQPPPATIVTERGDVPLLGPWPGGSSPK
jgi:hypothetical protein